MGSLAEQVRSVNELGPRRFIVVLDSGEHLLSSCNGRSGGGGITEGCEGTRLKDVQVCEACHGLTFGKPSAASSCQDQCLAGMPQQVRLG
ncbi:hypothetical protein [Micromonospora sp. IBHARD004]|uniref:hypothetical protein n=1 Tax=Micromonospora sp. IBHARD004 TaxID=3457764 RepID=UPI004057F574